MKFSSLLFASIACSSSILHAQDNPLNPDAAIPVAPLQSVRPDYTSATWLPAAETNFQTLTRPAPETPIDMVVMHDIEGTAASAMAWFQNTKARVSSHYVVDNGGRVWQMVRERDVAWHAGNSAINRRAVGIEMEGFAYRPGFYADALYEASATLVRDITTRHNIPRDRTHIIGHHEVPNARKPGSFGGGNGHTDPGPYWDWEKFLELVRNDAKMVSVNVPTTLHPGEIVNAEAVFLNRGDDAWAAYTSARNDPERARLNPVYLAASLPAQDGQTAPATLRRSPFFHFKSWISPTLLGGPTPIEANVGTANTTAQPNTDQAPTLPGQAARFSFQLQAPRVAGEFVEDFRLVKVAIAPRAPLFFGEPLRVRLNVKPWELEKPISDAGWSSQGWESKEAGGQKLLWRRATTSPASTNAVNVAQTDNAQWTGQLPIAGSWEVFALWPQGTNRTRHATYAVTDTNGPHKVPVDQTRDGGVWRSLGRFRFAKEATVALSAQGDRGVVVAQSLRFVGPFADGQK